MTVFVFGNPTVTQDSLPLKLLPRLRKKFPDIQFIHADPTENWWQGEKELVIIDTVQGIDNVTVFDSLDEFEKQSRITPHDYDLYMDLRILKKLGKVKKVKIIGITIGQSKQLIQQVVDVISKL